MITGLVVAMGGVGGFYLATTLGFAKKATGSYQAGFLGFAFLALPRRFEWIQLAIGAPAILLTFGFMVWYRGFTQEDRALFRKHGAEAPTLPDTEIATP